MRKVLFLFPPCIPSAAKSPYLAPHLLSTILREKGHEVENIDLNNKFVRRLAREHVIPEIEKEYLKQLSSDVFPSPEIKYLLQSGAAHCSILKKKTERGDTITFNQMIANANYVKDTILVHQVMITAIKV